MPMARRPAPSFFKILLDASAPHLPLPPEFVTKHLDNKIPKDPVIRSAIGGFSWRLKIKMIGENHCFADGWNNVVRDLQLGFGDFLVFRVFDKSIFKLLVYSPNGCVRDLPSVDPSVETSIEKSTEASGGQIDDDNGTVDEDYDDEIEEDEDEDEDEDDDDEDEAEEEEQEYDDGDAEEDDGDDDGDGDGDGGGDIDGNDGDPYFLSKMSKTNKNMLRLPAYFVELVGINGEGTITMKNLDDKVWEMGIRVQKLAQSERYYISAGWAEFRRSNDLNEGDECVFKFLRSEEKLLLARVTKKRKTSGKMPLAVRMKLEKKARMAVKRKLEKKARERGGRRGAEGKMKRKR